MYELFILGELMNNPMHGYLLHQILNGIVGPTRKVSWGAIYPLIHGMVADGLIEQVPDEQPEAPDKEEEKRSKPINLRTKAEYVFFG
ncbi:Transcriptional regulator PadR-like family protein [Paenibacillus sp. P1XP2]|nr:Transcriptional regulator PadR-like family protein [Paenibacillus sp. P1XP2]